MEAFGCFVSLSLAHHGAREQEMKELRERCEQLEKARRVELELSHLRRLREEANMCAAYPELTGATRTGSDMGTPPNLAPDRLCPIESIADKRSAAGPHRVVATGPVRRCRRQRLLSNEAEGDDATEGRVYGGMLFAAAKNGDLSRVAHLFDCDLEDTRTR